MTERMFEQLQSLGSSKSSKVHMQASNSKIKCEYMSASTGGVIVNIESNHFHFRYRYFICVSIVSKFKMNRSYW
jgi:hypothetical protein